MSLGPYRQVVQGRAGLSAGSYGCLASGAGVPV